MSSRGALLFLVVILFRVDAFILPWGFFGTLRALSKAISTPSHSINGDAAPESDEVNRFPASLVNSLDLVPLMEAVSRHAGTRRGRQSLLALVGADYEEPLEKTRHGEDKMDLMSPKSRRLRNSIQSGSRELSPRTSIPRKFTSSIARTLEDAVREYDLVSEASDLLQQPANYSYPPLSGPGFDPHDTENVAETDYDTWLSLPVEDWTLENILQAEQVVGTIRKVKEWADREEVSVVAPSIAAIGREIPHEEVLAPVADVIAGTVTIKRVRTVTDPSGRSSFSFQLSGEKFHVVQVLRRKVEEKVEEVAKSNNPQQSSAGQELSLLQEQLEATEQEILSSLSKTVKEVSSELDTSMNILARLDIAFAKAAFGEAINGLFPVIKNEGCISVKQFVHPVLSLFGNGHRVTPVDLNLSSEEGKRALIISGPNGGGKTLAMKSFGLSAVLCKLGIPIPSISQETSQPLQVDFFHDIHVALGDEQSLIDGESTMMARMNACSNVIKNVFTSNMAQETSSLVLLDELGGGTDPNAGGAIAQAILEKLLEKDACRIVATTHVPRLKVLSYQNSKQFGCATVLLETPEQTQVNTGQYQQPTFELLYGSIGDSYALGAASRCKPSLPEEVLSRAAQLMTTSKAASNDREGAPQVPSNDDDDTAYLHVLTQSLQRQSERARDARIAAEKWSHDSALCRRAMISLASSYDRQFSFLEQKLEDSFKKLKQDGTGSLELVGDTLAELRLAKKMVENQSELLKRRGLKLLPDWYDLEVGESIVIVSEGGLDGVSGKVLSQKEVPEQVLKPDDVAVLPTFTAWDDPFMAPDFEAASITNDTVSQQQKQVILKRSQVAIWDYDSVWDDCDEPPETISIKESKRRLNDILSNLKSSSEAAPKTEPKQSSETEQQIFQSSRERKAAKKKQPKSKKQKQRRSR